MARLRDPEQILYMQREFSKLKQRNFDLEREGNSFMNTYRWLEVGTTKPVYTVMAKSEKQAIAKLRKYLAKIAKEEIKLVQIQESKQ